MVLAGMISDLANTQINLSYVMYSIRPQGFIWIGIIPFKNSSIPIRSFVLTITSNQYRIIVSILIKIKTKDHPFSSDPHSGLEGVDTQFDIQGSSRSH